MNVIMPQLGETVEEGTVSAWRKKEGDKIAIDEVLVDIDTDKVATEVPSLVAGTLVKILIGAGETVKVGTPLAIIDTGDTTSAAIPNAASAPIPPPPITAVPFAQRDATPTKRDTHGARLSPVVRRLVAKHGVDIALVQGTGRDGRIKRNDVLSHLEKRQTPAPITHGDAITVPFTALRKRIAEHMVRSKATSAHVLQAVEVDFSAVDAARSALKKAWKDQEGISLTYLPFIARAVALALPDFPHLNAHATEDALIVYQAINLSLAVDLDHGGLIAPVIRNVGPLRVPELARAIAKIAAKARANALKPDDMTEGSYSLTNNGSFGTYLTAPIINQPQVAILSIDGIHRRPWVVADEAGERIEIRPVGLLAHSFDHRVVDGAYSGAYLRKVKQILESREWISEFLN